jgi:hypothetical protein
MTYRRELDGLDHVVVGRSADDRVRTRARYRPGLGLLELEHTVGSTTRRLVRLTESDP